MVATSRRFATSDNLLLLARVAEKWNCRPSDLLNSSMWDFQIDVAAAVAIWKSRPKAWDGAGDVIEW